MTTESDIERRKAQLLTLKAALADATNAVAALDLGLMMVAAEIIHPPPILRQDLELASLLIFSQTTLERRIDIVRKVIALRTGGLLKAKQHEYPHKLGMFIQKAFNLISASATKDVWIRNTAAHSNYMVPNDGDPTLIPNPFDFESQERFNERRGHKGRHPFKGAGLTASELTEFADSLAIPLRQYGKLGAILKLMLRGDRPVDLEAELIALGKDLKLQAPLQVRPRRERQKPTPQA